MSGLFTDVLWSETERLRKAIDDLEFLRRLADGTLPLEVFRTYIDQDALYLAGYAKALALLAARCPDPATAGFWARASATTATVELSLHQNLVRGGTLPEPASSGRSAGSAPESTGRSAGSAPASSGRSAGSAPAESPTHSPACLGYVSYLIAAAATEPYPVAAAAVLPCFWIYADVGKRLAAGAEQVLAADPGHPYATWVSTYDSPEFQEEVVAARAAVDRAAEAATDEQRAAMLEAFTIATRYELLFWDTALHPAPWPA